MSQHVRRAGVGRIAIHVHGIGCTLLGQLVHHHRRDRQGVDWLPQQDRPRGGELRGVRAVDRLGHRVGVEVGRPRIGPEGKASRVDGRPVRENDALDPAAVVALRGDEAYRRGIAERQVQHAVDFLVDAAARARIGGLRLARGRDCARIRHVGDQLDGAAHRARAVQRPLRTSQHLDPVQVVERRVDLFLAELRRGRRRQRRLVEVEADLRGVAPGGVEAAHLEFGLTGSGSAHGDTGDGLRKSIEVDDATIRDVLRGHGGDARGSRLNVLGALFRRDDHLGELISGIAGCGVGGVGALGERQRHCRRDRRRDHSCSQDHGVAPLFLTVA